MRSHPITFCLCLAGFILLSCTEEKRPSFPPGIIEGEDIAAFGVTLDTTALPLSEVENEQIATSASAANYYDYVENSTFDKQVKVTFSGGEATVEPSLVGMSVSRNGADVLITSSALGVEYVVKGSTNNGSLTINSKQNVKITLDGCQIKNPDGGVIEVTGAPYTYMVLADGDNYLEDGFVLKQTKQDKESEDDGSANYSLDELKSRSRTQANTVGMKKKKNSIKGTILTERNLIFSGRGRLSIQCNSKSGIRADEEVVFRPGTVVNVNTREGKGISGKTGIIIYGGVLNIDTGNSNKRGISSKGMLAIYGGRVTVLSAGGEKAEGIESKNVMLINGGDIRVAAFDDGINAGEDLVVNGGNLYICSSTNDALDANGNLIINGGTIVASGGREPECGLDANEEAGFRVFINGGTVVATGANNSIPSDKSKQASIIYGGELDSTGCIGLTTGATSNPLLAYNLMRDYGKNGQVLFSYDQISTGTAYDIVKGKAIKDESTFFGLTLHPSKINGKVVEKTNELKSMVSKVGTFPAPTPGGPMPPQ